MHGFHEIMLCRLVHVENDGILSRKMDNWVRVGIKNAIALFQTQTSLETRVILVQNPTKSYELPSYFNRIFNRNLADSKALCSWGVSSTLHGSSSKVIWSLRQCYGVFHVYTNPVIHFATCHCLILNVYQTAQHYLKSPCIVTIVNIRSRRSSYNDPTTMDPKVCHMDRVLKSMPPG